MTFELDAVLECPVCRCRVTPVVGPDQPVPAARDFAYCECGALLVFDDVEGLRVPDDDDLRRHVFRHPAMAPRAGDDDVLSPPRDTTHGRGKGG